MNSLAKIFFDDFSLCGHTFNIVWYLLVFGSAHEQKFFYDMEFWISISSSQSGCSWLMIYISSIPSLFFLAVIK
jgi:hypothetical protein